MTFTSRRKSRLVDSTYFPILLLLVVNLIVGALIFSSYGESWDEQLRYQYGERSRAAYRGEGKNLIDEKGAFYVMIASLGADLMRKINPSWQTIQAWHFIHFLSFLLGIFFVYKICLKLVGKWAALGVAVLFNTSPLLWGHAFINPKDIPFMSFFLGSVALGIDMADDHANQPGNGKPLPTLSPGEEIRATFQNELAAGNERRRKILAGIIVITLAILVGLAILQKPLLSQMSQWIQAAYRSESPELLNQIFNRLAENRGSVPVEQYTQKAEQFVERSLVILTMLWIGLFITLTWIMLPKISRTAWKTFGVPFFQQAGKSMLNPRVILAGIFLGLSTSIRVLGPASGLLVGLYFILKTKWRALPVLFAYITVAILATYLTWPYLWDALIRNFLHSLTIASDYPWEGNVRFQGIDYPINAVPRRYLPVLLTLQTPEVILALFLLGLIVAGYKLYTKQPGDKLILLAMLWFFAPLLAVIAFQPTLYDNFRQFLFILPAAYLFVALGLDFLLSKIKRQGFQVLLILVLVIPNLHWLVQLHPYQYIYYNSLVGNAGGAFRQFETDYWATSYREAIQFLNETAPTEATVQVVGPSHIVAHYARPDLKITDYSAKNPQEPARPFYTIIYTRYDKDLNLFPQAELIEQVERDGAILAVIKLVK
jgi:hypothetical protein